MLRNILYSVVLLQLISLIRCEDKLNITKIMIERGIVPDVIPRAPPELLQVIFPHGELCPGDVLTNIQCTYPPKLKWTHDNNSYYSVLMLGVTKWNQKKHMLRPYMVTLKGEVLPTTLHPPKYRISSQWFVLNIPGNNMNEGIVQDSYVPSIHVLKKTIPEHFVFLVYKQANKSDYDVPHPRFQEQFGPALSEERQMSVDVIRYIMDYWLEGADPIAGNYFEGHVSSKEDPLLDSMDHRVMAALDYQKAQREKEGVHVREIPVSQYTLTEEQYD